MKFTMTVLVHVNTNDWGCVHVVALCTTHNTVYACCSVQLLCECVFSRLTSLLIMLGFTTRSDFAAGFKRRKRTLKWAVGCLRGTQWCLEPAAHCSKLVALTRFCVYVSALYFAVCFDKKNMHHVIITSRRLQYCS